MSQASRGEEGAVTMWIFLNNAFLSIVQNNNGESEFLVRARVKGDLEEVFGVGVDVTVTEDSDYRYRIFLDKATVADVIRERMMGIDYGNFKNSIADGDTRRSRYYRKVWEVMRHWQMYE